MTSDSELLRRYAREKSEDAFAEVVRRHVDFVYSAARRLANGDAHLAQDVTQTVFAELARNAAKLSRHPSLAGWLHTTARFAIRNERVGEMRRRAREKEAAMQDNNPPQDLEWEKLQPVLDEAVGGLGRLDRDAVLLRFFESKSHREIGDLLGLNENAARMRVERALEKLRGHFARRGVRATAGVLAATIAANSVQAAPAGIATGVTGAALSGAWAAAGWMNALARIFFNMGAKAKIALVAAAVVLVAVPFIGSVGRPGLIRQALSAFFDQPVSPALVSANNKFAVDLYKQLAASSADNIFFSPHGVSTGLQMALAGARGQTATQLAAALHLDGQPAADVANEFGVLQRALARDSNRVQLNFGNALLAQEDHPFDATYLKQLQQDFAAQFIPADFKSDSAAASGKINAWVSGQTDGRATNILPPGIINSQMRMVVVNAIYFKGAWAEKFDPANTRPAPFHLADGTDKNIPMMNTKLTTWTAYISDGPDHLRILSLPYKGGALSFVVLLPVARDGLAALEKNLDADKLTAWLGQLKESNEKMAVGLPKFKLDERVGLNDALMGLGVNDAFRKSADFSGMDGARDLYISELLHQAGVEVNEEGTTAFAINLTFIAILGVERPFVADHPFIFLIRDNATGSILFMGRLVSPP